MQTPKERATGDEKRKLGQRGGRNKFSEGGKQAQGREGGDKRREGKSGMKGQPKTRHARQIDRQQPTK